MQDLIRAFYYPDFFIDQRTLVRAILLFDELHFMDRPSIGIGDNFGTIGADSPLRSFEKSFREAGIPFYVHSQPRGGVSDALRGAITNDISDLRFIDIFQQGLVSSSQFRGLQISPGNYGEVGNQDDVARKIQSVQLKQALANYSSPLALFEDKAVKHFDFFSAAGCAKQLITDAAVCSAKMNLALHIGSANEFHLLADAAPYGELLKTKFETAMSQPTVEPKVQITDLSFAIFDELVPLERAETMSLKEAVEYRRSSNKARKAFLETVIQLQKKQSGITEQDYASAVRRIVEQDIIPAARRYRNELQTIDEGLAGALAKRGLLGVAGSSFLSFLGDISWHKILLASGFVGAHITGALIDARLKTRAAERDCSISYLLSLD